MNEQTIKGENNKTVRYKLPKTFYKYQRPKNKLELTKEEKKYYYLWTGMKARCYSERHKQFARYGGRGIKICKQWHDVRVFIDWCIATYPKDGEKYSLDRKNNDRGYMPSNCRWATAKEQANNRSSNVVYKGKTLSQWADELGCRETTINRRLHVMHWSLKKAVSTPVRRKSR